VVNFEEVFELLPQKKIDDLKWRIKVMVFHRSIICALSSIGKQEVELAIRMNTEK